MGVIKASKSELRCQPYCPGYLNRKMHTGCSVCYFGYVQSIIKDQSFLIHIPGYLSQTPDSQGGKPPRDLWFAFSMQILKGTFWGWEKQRDDYDPEKHQRRKFKGLSHSKRARWHGRDKLLHLLYYNNSSSLKDGTMFDKPPANLWCPLSWSPRLIPVFSSGWSQDLEGWWFPVDAAESFELGFFVN